MAEDRAPSKRNHLYYTIAQVAERWQCSEKHVRRLVEAKELVAHKFGNLLRVSDDDLLRYERMNRMD